MSPEALSGRPVSAQGRNVQAQAVPLELVRRARRSRIPEGLATRVMETGSGEA